MSSLGNSVASGAAAIRASRLQVLGVSTRVLESGPTSAREAVLMVHGGPGSAEDWQALMPQIGAIARAVAVDLPGFGQADRPKDWSHTSRDWARFLEGVRQTLGLTRVHLVLNDLGGQAGLAWGVAHPESFASVVLINAGALSGYRWHPLARLHRLPLVGDVVARLGAPGMTSLMRLYEPQLASDVLRRWREHFDWGTRRALLRFYRATSEQSLGALAPGLRRLDKPALVIWGANDRFVPANQAERQLESFPNARIVRIDGAYHYPHIESPERVIEAVVAFLSEQRRSGSDVRSRAEEVNRR